MNQGTAFRVLRTRQPTEDVNVGESIQRQICVEIMVSGDPVSLRIPTS